MLCITIQYLHSYRFAMHRNGPKCRFALTKLGIFMQKRMKTPRGILPSEQLFILFFRLCKHGHDDNDTSYKAV